jgi:hypothetical protein
MRIGRLVAAVDADAAAETDGPTVALVLGCSDDPQPASVAVAASTNTADARRFIAS